MDSGKSLLDGYLAPLMSECDDSGLLIRCRQGDSQAWNELFDRHYPAAGRFVIQLSPDFTKEDVDDICQETFLAVIRNIQSFQENCQFQTWLFRIAANKARDYRQRKNAAKRGGGQMLLSLQNDCLEDGPIIDPPSELPAPDAHLIHKEQLAVIRHALDRLAEPCREIIELRYFGDLRYEEIAAVLNLNPKTVSSRLSKCLGRFEEIAKGLLNREKSASPSV